MPEYIKIVCWVLFVFSLCDICTTIQAHNTTERLQQRGIPARVRVWTIFVTITLIVFDVIWLSYNITGGK